MGHKVNPCGFRLGKLYTWKSKWFAEGSDYKKFLLKDIELRSFLMENLKTAGITKVEIERSINTIEITLYVSRPGVVIGRGGSRLKALKEMLNKKLGINPKDVKAMKVELKVEEVKNYDLSAWLICQRLVDQLAKRYPHRRAVAMAMKKTMGAGAKGIKVVFSGRIAGAEIGRTEKYTSGSVPLQTLRADIDYAQAPSLTKSGYIGIKVWVYKGEREIG